MRVVNGQPGLETGQRKDRIVVDLVSSTNLQDANIQIIK
jgi:hypothetical protein